MSVSTGSHGVPRRSVKRTARDLAFSGSVQKRFKAGYRNSSGSNLVPTVPYDIV